MGDSALLIPGNPKPRFAANLEAWDGAAPSVERTHQTRPDESDDGGGSQENYLQ